MLFSVITKNSNWGTLTKNLVIFKMVLRMKNLNIEKLEKLWGSLPKKGAELGHFADLIPQCTLCSYISLESLLQV